jgi:Spy/CpxP family protein refolding chaperone
MARSFPQLRFLFRFTHLMKKTLFLLAALALTTAGPSFAQTSPAKTSAQAKPKKTPEQKADHKASKKAKELGLTADQEARVEQLMLTRHQETAAFKAKYGNDKNAGRADMKAAHERYQAQLKSILTADQYAKLSQLKDERRSQNQAKSASKTKAKTKA